MASSPHPIPLVVIATLFTITAAFAALVRPIPSEPSVPAEPPTSTGTITGNTRTIDGLTPGDLAVCAQPTTGGARICTTLAAVASYELRLAPGQYLVSAHRVSEPEREAFYTDRVTCTNLAGCSGQPIVVSVGAGQRLTGIDPIDWNASP